MTRLMDGDRLLLLLRHHLGLLLQSTNDTVNSIQEVLLAYSLTIMTGSYQGSFVTYVGNVGTRESRCLTSQEVDIYRIVELQGLQVYHEYLLTLVQVGQIYMYLTVETSSTQQCRVQHIGTVGSSQCDDTTVSAKSVHLGKQCVQRILALIITTHGRVLRASTTYGVNLVDKDDTRSLGLSLLEEVANARATHTHEHLYEVRTRHREEGYASLTSHSLSQQRLTRSWRAYQQSALGYLTTQVGIFLRILQEVNNFLHLLLSTSLSGHILKGDAQLAALLIHLRLRLAYAKQACSAEVGTTATHTTHDKHP